MAAQRKQCQSRQTNQSQNQRSENKNSGIRYMAIAAIRAVEGAGNERRRILSFSSEEPYMRYFGTEILDHFGGSVDLSRLNTIGVLLFNHDRDKVIGKVVRAWVENGRGLAEVEFDTDDEAEIIFKKVESGTLKGVSVAYNVSVWEEVSAGKSSCDGRFQGPCSVAKSWTPLEISVVSVPADATVGVGRDMTSSAPPLCSGCLTADEAKRQVSINNNYILGGKSHE